MVDITFGITIAAISIMLVYFICQDVVKRELARALPEQLQTLRDTLDGELEVRLNIKPDGETTIKEVEKE